MLSDPYFWTASGAAVLSGLLCSLLGNFLLMRNWTFTGLAASQMAALGAAVFLGVGWPAETGAFLTTLLTLVLLGRPTRGTAGRIEDRTLALCYLTGATFTLLWLNQLPRLHSHGFDPLQGNILYAQPTDLLRLAGAFLPLALAVGIFHRELTAVALDPEAARAHGLPIGLYRTGLLLSLGLVIALTLRITGTLFVFAMLVLPPFLALNLLRRTSSILLVSPLFAAAAAFSGTALSWHQDWPTAPTIIALLLAAYLTLRFLPTPFLRTPSPPAP